MGAARAARAAPRARRQGAGKAGARLRRQGRQGRVAGRPLGPGGLLATSRAPRLRIPITAQALDIARQLKNGQLKNKEEATKKLVAEILKEKLRMKSKALTDKIADALQDDPRLNQALERLWSKAE